MTRISLMAAAVLGCMAMVCSAHAEGAFRGLSLINSAHAPVSAFYASNAGGNAWTPNLLDGSRLRPNHYVQLGLADATGRCRFDFKTVFADGTSVVRHNVDACVLGQYTVTD